MITILAYTIIKSFGLLYFVIAKFSVTTIPDRCIIVMLPILNQHLDFHLDMIPIIYFI